MESCSGYRINNKVWCAYPELKNELYLWVKNERESKSKVTKYTINAKAESLTNNKDEFVGFK